VAPRQRPRPAPAAARVRRVLRLPRRGAPVLPGEGEGGHHPPRE
jgi:hypothetical protein